MEREIEIDYWGDFENAALSPDDSEKEEYLDELMKNYPESYFIVLSSIYRNLEAVKLMYDENIHGHHEDRLGMLKSFFADCVNHVHVEQTMQQQDYIIHEYNKVSNTDDPDQLKGIKSSILEIFNDPVNRALEAFGTYDPNTYERNNVTISIIDDKHNVAISVNDSIILRYNHAFRELVSFIDEKIESLQKRGKLKRLRPEPSPRGQTTMPNTEATEAPKLVWTANKTGLYELIYALKGVKALQTQDDKPATLKDIFSAFNVIGKFEDGKGISEKEIYKGFGKYISGKKDKVKKNRFYTDQLQSKFIESLQQEIQEEIERREKES